MVIFPCLPHRVLPFSSPSALLYSDGFHPSAHSQTNTTTLTLLHSSLPIHCIGSLAATDGIHKQSASRDTGHHLPGCRSAWEHNHREWYGHCCLLVLLDARLMCSRTRRTGCILHPRCTIIALEGSGGIGLGEGCIVEETAVILNRWVGEVP